MITCALPKMRRHERTTLRSAVFGEVGRGAFAAVRMEFAPLVAIAHFGVEDRLRLWLLTSGHFIGLLSALLLYERLATRTLCHVAASGLGPAMVLLISFGLMMARREAGGVSDES